MKQMSRSIMQFPPIISPWFTQPIRTTVIFWLPMSNHASPIVSDRWLHWKSTTAETSDSSQKVQSVTAEDLLLVCDLVIVFLSRSQWKPLCEEISKWRCIHIYRSKALGRSWLSIKWSKNLCQCPLPDIYVSDTSTQGKISVFINKQQKQVEQRWKASSALMNDPLHFGFSFDEILWAIFVMDWWSDDIPNWRIWHRDISKEAMMDLKVDNVSLYKLSNVLMALIIWKVLRCWICLYWLYSICPLIDS